MHNSIMAKVTALQASGCVQPPTFKQTAGVFGDYETYALANGLSWGMWRADEQCASASLDDVEDSVNAPLVPFCAPPPPPPQNPPLRASDALSPNAPTQRYVPL
jgi:hypothetical protein